MEGKIQEKLKSLNKNAVLFGTLYSYVESITEMFLSDPEAFYSTCDKLGISLEEMLELLSTANLNNIALFDEIMDMNAKKDENVLGR